MNEIIWLVTLVLCFSGILVFYKLFGKMGLYAWPIMAIIAANIQVVKVVNLFGLETVMGTIIYSSIFLVINILIEKYGKKEAKKAINISIVTMITMTILMALCTLYKPSINDTANESLKLIFSINMRIAIGSVTAYLISQLCNIVIYQKLRDKYHKIWISNSVSTIIAQLIDTIIFLSIAFIGIQSINILIEMLIARYLFKFVIAIISNPIIYITNKIKVE